MDDWRIEPLDRAHEREPFSCGKPLLDEFLRRLVSEYEKRNLGRTYVAVRPGQNDKRVYGYYTVASGSILFENAPKKAARKLPKHPLPIALVGRFAVDQSAQGQGLGEFLLIDALKRCLEVSDRLGIHAVEVHAIDLEAKSFYEKYGFEPLVDRELHLYLPIATIRETFGT